MKNFIRKVFQKLINREVIVYLIFGVLTTGVNYLSLYLLNKCIPLDKIVISNTIAWIVSVLFAYITNKIWVFQSRSWKIMTLIREILSFTAGRVITLLIEDFGLVLLVNLWSWKVFIAKVLLSVIVIVLNYVFSKLLVFVKKKNNKEPDNEAETKEI